MAAATVSVRSCVSSSKSLFLLSRGYRYNHVSYGLNRLPMIFQSKRTLLSDAYHADDIWINRERIVVDMDEMKINLDRSFNDLKEPVSSVELHKYIDNVYDKEELDVAEGYLYSHRHSPVAYHLRPSTVHSWLRLCIELGSLDQALRVLQNKRDYGLFPDHFTYNVLLDTFLRADNIKGACDVAVVMMKEETLEDCPLSQLLALYSCHRYLQKGDIPEEEQWDIGMTLADSTHGVEGVVAQSYHALGYAMTGDLKRTVRALQAVASNAGAKITQEAIDRLAGIIQGMEDPSADLMDSYEAVMKQLSEGDHISSDSLDSLLEVELTSRLPDLETRDIAPYEARLEGWHREHMEALERQRLAVLAAEREEKERRLDQLQREAGGMAYWEEQIKEAQLRRKGREVGDRQEASGESSGLR